MVGDKKSVAMLDENGKVIGAVSKSGDTMTGGLTVVGGLVVRNDAAGRTAGRYISGNGDLVLDNAKDANNYSQIVFVKEGGEPSIVLQVCSEGVTITRTVYHDGNLTELRDALKAIW